MRISGLVMTRDEGDVIESFCRYTLTYCDSIVIYDNGSIDNTPDIIRELVNEGLNIYFINDAQKYSFDREYTELKKHALFKNDMIQIAIDLYGADLFMPLDPDEFLCDINGDAPRRLLERLDENTHYEVPWRTYVYSKNPDDNSVFLPDYFSEYRMPSLDRYRKVVLSKKLYDQGVKLGYGYHMMDSPQGFSFKNVVVDDLVLAHFPIRNSAQTMTKAITGWIQISALTRHKDDSMFNYGHMYREIMEDGEASYEMMRKFSLEYSLYRHEVPKEITTFKCPLNTSGYNAGLKLKYTDYSGWKEKLLLKSILSEMDHAEKEYNRILDEMEIKESQLKNELEKLTWQIKWETEDRDRVIEDRKRDIQNLLNSKSYRLGRALTKPVRMLLPKKN